MAKKKVYAVRKGKKEGIFETWDACKAAVEGYPGAEYRGFATREEALAYLGKDSGISSGPAADQVTAYVDGSFDQKIGKYAFGCILLLPGGEIVRKSGNGDNPESAALRNVTGEMLGAMFAVKWCMVNRFSSVKICYDYSGIEMWAAGRWKTNNPLTKKYADYMRLCSRSIEISFRKVQAHTGDQYNEEADRLAKAALTAGNGIPKIKESADGTAGEV